MQTISDVRPTLPPVIVVTREKKVNIKSSAGQKGCTSQALPVKNDGWVSQPYGDPTIAGLTGHHEGDSSTNLVSPQTSPSRTPRVPATEGNVFKDISSNSESWQKKSNRRDEIISALPGQLVRKWSSTLTVSPPCLP